MSSNSGVSIPIYLVPKKEVRPYISSSAEYYAQEVK
jgi:hypothetical protein